MIKTGKNLWRNVEHIMPEHIIKESPDKDLFSDLGWKSYWIAQQVILPILNETMLKIAETEQPSYFLNEVDAAISIAVEECCTLDEFFRLPWREFKHMSEQNFELVYRHRYDMIPPEWEDHENTSSHIDKCEICSELRYG